MCGRCDFQAITQSRVRKSVQAREFDFLNHDSRTCGKTRRELRELTKFCNCHYLTIQFQVPMPVSKSAPVSTPSDNSTALTTHAGGNGASSRTNPAPPKPAPKSSKTSKAKSPRAPAATNTPKSAAAPKPASAPAPAPKPASAPAPKPVAPPSADEARNPAYAGLDFGVASKPAATSNLEVDEPWSDESDAHTSDGDFLDGYSSGDGWEEDNAILTADSSTFRGNSGGTIGLKRFSAMIASIERRAIAQETKRNMRKAKKQGPAPVPLQ